MRNKDIGHPKIFLKTIFLELGLGMICREEGQVFSCA
jgi:hypothetical protein